jgi:hypothetical protein
MCERRPEWRAFGVPFTRGSGEVIVAQVPYFERADSRRQLYGTGMVCDHKRIYNQSKRIGQSREYRRRMGVA